MFKRIKCFPISAVAINSTIIFFYWWDFLNFPLKKSTWFILISSAILSSVFWIAIDDHLLSISTGEATTQWEEYLMVIGCCIMRWYNHDSTTLDSKGQEYYQEMMAKLCDDWGIEICISRRKMNWKDNETDVQKKKEFSKSSTVEQAVLDSEILVIWVLGTTIFFF